MNKDQFREHMQRLEKKLEKNPSLRQKMAKHVKALEDIMEASVQITVSLDHEQMNEFGDKVENEYLNNNHSAYEHYTMSLDDLRNFINDPDDDGNLKVYIDNVYLDEGLNAVQNIFVVPTNDKIILAPKGYKKNEE